MVDLNAGESIKSNGGTLFRISIYLIYFSYFLSASRINVPPADRSAVSRNTLIQAEGSTSVLWFSLLVCSFISYSSFFSYILLLPKYFLLIFLIFHFSNYHFPYFSLFFLLRSFRRGEVSYLIVTDLAARGIDVPLLDNVINFHFPQAPKLFVHRCGRAARQGEVLSDYYQHQRVVLWVEVVVEVKTKRQNLFLISFFTLYDPVVLPVAQAASGSPSLLSSRRKSPSCWTCTCCWGRS